MKRFYKSLLSVALATGFLLSSFAVNAQVSRGGACYFGNYNAGFTDPSSISPNYLFALPYNAPSDMTITHLGMKGNNSNSGVQMALYADNNGAPGAVLAYTALHTVQSGDMILPISPIEVNAGQYWIAMIFENLGNHVSINLTSSNAVYYIPLTYGSGLPTTFNWNANQASYTGQDFNLWATAATTSETFINSCGPYTYNGETYTSNAVVDQVTNEAGCYEIVSMNIQIFPAVNSTVSQSGSTLTANQNGVDYQWVDCNMSNQPIEGATQQSFTPSVSGLYAVLIFTDYCDVSSECIAVTVEGPGVGIENQSAQFVHVYPNPANNTLNIELKEMAKIQIVSVSGQVIMDLDAAQTHQVDLSSLSQGVYFVRVDNETLRFVKQ